jgi:hypothetical protein
LPVKPANTKGTEVRNQNKQTVASLFPHRGCRCRRSPLCFQSQPRWSSQDRRCRLRSQSQTCRSRQPEFVCVSTQRGRVSGKPEQRTHSCVRLTHCAHDEVPSGPVQPAGCDTTTQLESAGKQISRHTQTHCVMPVEPAAETVLTGPERHNALATERGPRHNSHAEQAAEPDAALY